MGGYIPEDQKSYLISIYSYDNRSLSGTISHPLLAQPRPFGSTLELLTALEELLDQVCFPARGMQPRRFADTPAERAAADGGRQPGGEALARFQLRVLFRQNASWQGSVLWLERGQELRFRSVLELLLLMDGALAAGTRPGAP